MCVRGVEREKKSTCAPSSAIERQSRSYLISPQHKFDSIFDALRRISASRAPNRDQFGKFGRALEHARQRQNKFHYLQNKIIDGEAARRTFMSAKEMNEQRTVRRRIKTNTIVDMKSLLSNENSAKTQMKYSFFLAHSGVHFVLLLFGLIILIVFERNFS